MEGYKDLKIHQNINVKLTVENPSLQVSIGTLESLRLNNMKYNPAIVSGILLLIVVSLSMFLGNLMSYLIEDFQSDDDSSEYLVWIYVEIIFLIMRIFIPTLIIYQNQGCRQFMKSSVNELASEFKCLRSRNPSRLSTNTISTLVLNIMNIKLQEPSDKPDLKNIDEEIKNEQELAQEIQSVIKGKGKGKGQSNFKKGKVMSPKYISEDKPEGIK